jgi:hypothetical protein
MSPLNFVGRQFIDSIVMALSSKDFNSEQQRGQRHCLKRINNAGENNPCVTSKCKGCYLTSRKFTKIRTRTLRREGSYSLEESQRSIYDDSTIKTKNFESWEIGLESSFIMTPFAIMLAMDAIVPNVQIIS